MLSEAFNKPKEEQGPLTKEESLVFNYLEEKLNKLRARDVLDSSEAINQLHQIILNENPDFEFYEDLRTILENLHKRGY